MTTIRMLHEVDPGTPATDQHPDAVRYPVVAGPFRFADCVGGAPTQPELDARVGLDAAGLVLAARLAADAADLVALKADTNTMAFVNFSFTQLDNWVDNNVGAASVNTVALLKAACVTAFKVLGRIALVAVRKWVRNGA